MALRQFAGRLMGIVRLDGTELEVARTRDPRNAEINILDRCSHARSRARITTPRAASYRESPPVTSSVASARIIRATFHIPHSSTISGGAHLGNERRIAVFPNFGDDGV